MTKPIASNPSCDTGNLIVTGVAVAATAALATGIVLAILQQPGALSTALMATGGAVNVLALVYLFCSCRAQKRQKEQREKLGFAPEQVGYIRIAQAVTTKNREELRAIASTLLRNWNQAKSKQTSWTKDELAGALGISEMALGQILGQLCIPEPGDGRYQTAALERKLQSMS